MGLITTELVDNEMLALPASSGQKRFWILDQIKPGDPSLNVAVRFGLTGYLDADAMERALNEIVRRHETLRASFAMIDGEVVQLVAPSLSVALPVVDLRSIPVSQRQIEADRLASEEAQEPFDLSTAPLLRAQLLRLDEDEHTLLITIHHIISDGWSIGIITDELGVIYEAFREGMASPLPELPIQYADVTVWQEQNRNHQRWVESEQYWQRQLTGAPQFEVMPDHRRGATADAVGNILSRLLSIELTDALRPLSREHNATLFMTMLAGLTTLLHRYSGETDIVVGSQVAGRNTVDVEPLIGPFINTLVLRTDASGDPQFSELLSRVRDAVSDALAHQEMPLERVAELLKVERNADRNLLFNINFIYQRDFVKPWEHGGIRMRPIPSRSPGAMYDLNVFLVERNDGWRLSCEYNTALFFEDTVKRMLEHFERLLSAILEDPKRRISEYSFLSPAEETRILHEWNRTAAAYPSDSPFTRLFEQQVERTPNAVAVVFNAQTVTYRELNARANRFAHYLKRGGIGRGSLAGIQIERSIEMLVAVLAVLKTGAAYVPLDPSFPEMRLEFMKQDAGLELVITKPLLQSAEIAKQNGANLAEAADPADRAYVIYTSGSTGKPKGVEIPHRALVNLLWAVLDSPGLTSRDALLAVTTLSFDIAGLELFAPLLAGARIVLASRDQAAGGAELRKLIAISGATVLQATPATWRMLIDAGWSNTPHLKMLCGGEPLSRSLADALLERGGELWNMYGPTETTIWSSWRRIERDGEPITIGRPAPNQFFYVLDQHQRPVPEGVPGELYIGGDGVACGYLNRPELTAERFVPNPFAPGRMYRTGDRARFRPNGAVEMLGRMDTQVKIRGFRIEIGEVEAALAGCPEVRNAAVVVREDATGEPVLAGYFVPVNAGNNAVDSIRHHLRQRLPEYMVPTYLTALAEIPQTPNGKLDRKALPSPEAVRVIETDEQSAPSDRLELLLTGIWEQVLSIRPIRRSDNFFEIGGHSVLAARMFARLEKTIGKALPLATLFQAPTIEKLAAVLRDSGWTPPWSSLVPIRPNGSKPPFYFVHPIGGNVLNFAGFAAHFDAEQPIYGLQARGLDGKEAPNISVEQMAADYIGDIRSVQPQGPYYIGGFSAGGVVAFEMARQLRAAGETVAMLALLDAKNHVPLRHAASSALSTRGATLVRTVRFNLRYAFHIGLGAFSRQKLKNWRLRAQLRLWTTKRSLGLNPDSRGLGVEEAFLFALRNYRPQPYEGDAILFRAKDELVSYEDPTLGWDGLVGNLEIREISGDHDTILYEPHIGCLARVLDSCLAAVQSCFINGNRNETADRRLGILEQSA